MNAVNKKMTRWGLGVVAATASLGLFVATASAQLAPAPKAPATTATPPAPAAKAPATAAKAPEVKKAASACKGLDEAACKVNTECTYVVPTKANKATGKVQAAYCKKSPPAPKKDAKKVEAPKGSAAPATTAPKGSAAPAATTPPAPKKTP